MPPHPHDSPNAGSPRSPSKPKEKFQSLILKAIIMMFLISFFFLLLPLASFLLLLLLPLLLRHQRHGDVCHSHPSSGFSPKQLKMLPQFRFSQETKPTHLEFDSCVICLDGFGRGQLCRNLVGCGHLFHRKCLDAWLMKVAACPICRTRVCLDNEDNGIWGFGTRRTDFQGLLDLDIKLKEPGLSTETIMGADAIAESGVELAMGADAIAESGARNQDTKEAATELEAELELGKEADKSGTGHEETDKELNLELQ